jgi:hypothetical protein
VEVVTAHPIVDAVLDRHRDALGDDLPTYRNHVYRCINYHQLLLGASIPDFAALAWAAHDLGIWTARTFDYLTPSARPRCAACGGIRNHRNRPATNVDHRTPPAAAIG